MMPWHWTGSFSAMKSDRHELVFHASAQDFGGLAQSPRNLVKTRDVVFVVLDRIEGDRKRHIREIGMDAILLIDWHLVLFEVEVGDALLQHANQQVVRELVLIGEAGRRDGFESREEALIGFVPLHDGVERVLGELVVVAIVAEGRGALGKVAQIGLVILLENARSVRPRGRRRAWGFGRRQNWLRRSGQIKLGEGAWCKQSIKGIVVWASKASSPPLVLTCSQRGMILGHKKT